MPDVLHKSFSPGWGLLDVSELRVLFVTWLDEGLYTCLKMSGYCQRAVVFNKGEDLCADPEQDGELNSGIHWEFVLT